jgi:signal transduction histidine kinase
MQHDKHVPKDRASEGLLTRQREVNEKLVLAGVQAQDEADDAKEAQARAEAISIELRESEQRYRALFDLSPVAVYSCDASGVIQKFNQNAAELWGRQPEVGDTDEHFCGSFKMFRPDGTFLPHDLCPMAEVVTGKLAEVRDAEVFIERPDGSRVTVLVNIRPVKNHVGEVTGAINCFYDITERKDAERRLVESLNLERELAEFREKFIGIIGHDLRNPLNTIVMAAGCQLAHGSLTDEDARFANRIVTSAHRMARMIGQLVDFTRARLGGGFDLKLEPTDLGEVCRDIVDELSVGASAEFRQTAEGDVSGTWDNDRLAEALSNIAGNAVDHSAPGTPILIHVRGESEAVVVEITNQGACIPPAILPVIFKAFRRAKANAHIPSNGHLGLGLYIASEVVRSHGGKLDVRSSDGSTTFTMWLPRSLP